MRDVGPSSEDVRPNLLEVPCAQSSAIERGEWESVELESQLMSSSQALADVGARRMKA